MSRQSLRREMRQRRRNLTPRARRTAAQQLARHLGGTPLFHRARHIALYLSNDGEMDLTPLLTLARARGKQCYLPVLSPAFHNRLWFAPWRPHTPLLPNTFGIPEPALPWRAMRPAWALDLVLTPLVAFDPEGNRLGMGGGFYDRTFAYLRQRRHWCKPHLIGVAYRFQQVAALPCQPWDVPLAGVVTEAGGYGRLA